MLPDNPNLLAYRFVPRHDQAGKVMFPARPESKAVPEAFERSK
jgi:hypothetical protein